MKDNQNIRKETYAILIVFFVLISSVFAADLLAGNFGSEEKMKRNSLIFSKSPSSYIKKLGIPEQDVIEGQKNWLFYRPYVRSIIQKDINQKAVNEIAFMKDKLKGRGVKLIVVPVPVKVQLHSDQLDKVSTALDTYKKYITALKGNDIDVVDLSQDLNFPKSYLEADTHWSPAAVDKTAKLISTKVSTALLDRSIQLKQNIIPLEGRGNLSKTLSEMVLLSEVLDRKGDLYTPSEEGEILVLGDSFTNVFSESDLGWGTGAGLAERLAFHLQRPVDKIAVNNGGESGSRNLLIEELATGYDRLENKKYVIWEFNFREFSKENWSHFEFPKKTALGFLEVDKEMEVRGEVLGISQMNSNSVYKDQLVSVRMKVGDKQALFRAYFKKDNQLTEVFRLRAGDGISVVLRPLPNEVERQNRTDFGDMGLQLQSYSLGEVKTGKFNPAKWNLYIVLIFLGILCIRFSRRSV